MNFVVVIVKIGFGVIFLFVKCFGILRELIVLFLFMFFYDECINFIGVVDYEEVRICEIS